MTLKKSLQSQIWEKLPEMSRNIWSDVIVAVADVAASVSQIFTSLLEKTSSKTGKRLPVAPLPLSKASSMSVLLYSFEWSCDDVSQLLMTYDIRNSCGLVAATETLGNSTTVSTRACRGFCLKRSKAKYKQDYNTMDRCEVVRWESCEPKLWQKKCAFVVGTIDGLNKSLNKRQLSLLSNRSQSHLEVKHLQQNFGNLQTLAWSINTWLQIVARTKA